MGSMTIPTRTLMANSSNKVSDDLIVWERYDLKSGARVALSVASVKEKPPLGPFDRLKVVTVLKRLAQCLQPLSIKELGL